MKRQQQQQWHNEDDDKTHDGHFFLFFSPISSLFLKTSKVKQQTNNSFFVSITMEIMIAVKKVKKLK